MSERSRLRPKGLRWDGEASVGMPGPALRPRGLRCDGGPSLEGEGAPRQARGRRRNGATSRTTRSGHDEREGLRGARVPRAAHVGLSEKPCSMEAVGSSFAPRSRCRGLARRSVDTLRASVAEAQGRYARMPSKSSFTVRASSSNGSRRDPPAPQTGAGVPQLAQNFAEVTSLPQPVQNFFAATAARGPPHS